jgi:hypothetical protein
MDFLYEFLQKFLLAAVPVIVPFVVAWLIAKTRESWMTFAKEKPEIAYAVQEAARMAVSAAEQSNLAGYIIDKKLYALDAAAGWLEAQNIKVDIKVIESAIEAAVFNELNKNKLTSG